MEGDVCCCVVQAKDREIAVLECGGGDAVKEEQLQHAAVQRVALEEEVERQKDAARELQGELKVGSGVCSSCCVAVASSMACHVLCV